MTYDEAKAEAQERADRMGIDHGVEKLGQEYRFFILPRKENRQGHELRCEVVSCSDLSRVLKGHGP